MSWMVRARLSDAAAADHDELVLAEELREGHSDDFTSPGEPVAAERRSR